MGLFKFNGQRLEMGRLQMSGNQNPIIKALRDELKSKREIDFSKECEKAQRCCESCHQRIINSEIYFMYGHEAATARLLPILERAIKVIQSSQCAFNTVSVGCREVDKQHCTNCQKCEFLASLKNVGAGDNKEGK